MRRAFSLVELVLVIVILGILATLGSQTFKRNTRFEAINHILTMMRYTQNLALHDSKHNKNDSRWQRSFWRFEINKCANSSQIFYKIGTDADYNMGINRSESAIDPANGKFTFWDTRKACPKNSTDALNAQVSPNIFLSQRYGISSVRSDNCKIWGQAGIGFDNYGRPIESYQFTNTPDYKKYLNKDCTFTFSFQDSKIKPFQIVIKRESGYIYLKENPNL